MAGDDPGGTDGRVRRWAAVTLLVPRRVQVFLLAGFLLLAACGDSTADSSTDATDSSTGSSRGSSSEASAPAGANRVVEVIDGDTIDVTVDGGAVERVRVVGINAPERGECLADEATAWMEDRIGDEAVALVADRSDRDQYGRLLRYVELDGVDVGEMMVAQGLAMARRYPPDTARADRLDAAQASAEEASRGMWGPEACGAAPSGAGGLTISDVNFDAEGPDADNANDEWVQITNDGPERVDLDGWRLRDESASNRYDFPAGFGLAPGSTVTVRTGCGSDSATDLHWCASGAAVWNNDGDTAFLLDPAGNIVTQRGG